MTAKPIEEIEAWSKTLSPWRKDCLRRLAISDELTSVDVDELLAMIKQVAGFDLATPALTPVPFAKAHFGGDKREPIILKGIANVENVNRLVSRARLDFCPKALTVIYELSLKVGDGGIGWHIKALFTRRSSRREKDML